MPSGQGFLVIFYMEGGRGEMKERTGREIPKAQALAQGQSRSHVP